MEYKLVQSTKMASIYKRYPQKLLFACLIFSIISACVSIEKIHPQEENLLVETDIKISDSGYNHSTTDFFIDALKIQDFDAAASKFDANVKASLSSGSLAKVWKSQTEMVGPINKWSTLEFTKKGDNEIGLVLIEFEKGKLQMIITINSQTQEIAGIFFNPAPKGQTTPHQTSSKVLIEKVSVGKKPYLLDGSIMYPIGDVPFPGVVLVQGSGPLDMDASIGANAPFRDLAEGLASQGIAVLRYNKRFFQYKEQNRDVTVDEEVIEDAISALALLKTKPYVNAKQVFIIGHSLGAQLAPEIAFRSHSITGLVLLAPPARTPREYILEQLRYLNAPTDLITKTEDDFKLLENGHIENVNILGTPGIYWKDLASRDGIQMAKKLGKPILILWGDRDYQVGEEDLNIWKKKLNHIQNVKIMHIAGVNHLFIKEQGNSRSVGYSIPGKVDEVVIKELASFIKSVVLR